ncbi:hypothetical protein [Pontibaca salina]|uniref:Uncharacterized protein n=1 Tax=Pontibaca salina TaxID=2795731 RepID=A0A934HRI4_9RHOB|nr:hypothetical protein [Pontibaca salina]MBI6630422.1 hypothetical protein [Pontibaca salina]
MTLITPEERIHRTAELLASLEDSIRDLRRQAEDLSRQLQAGEDADLVTGTRRVAAVEALLRTCQKVEASLVEQQQQRQAGNIQGGQALDLVQARLEVGCRLARLRACCDPGKISE